MNTKCVLNLFYSNVNIRSKQTELLPQNNGPSQIIVAKTQTVSENSRT